MLIAGVLPTTYGCSLDRPVKFHNALRERCPYTEQAQRWRQALQDANKHPVLSLKE
jgi:hypothetical protein